MSYTAQADRHANRQYNYSGPPWYSPPLNASFERNPLARYCHSSHIGRQTSENLCGLRFAFPLTDRRGTERLFRRRINGDLNTKYVQWNLRLNTRRGKLLLEYANENTSLSFGPDTQIINPSNPSATPDLLDNVIKKNLSSTLYLTSYSAVRTYQIPVLTHKACRSSFQHPTDTHDFRRTDFGNFHPQ